MADNAHVKKFLQLPFLAQRIVIWKIGASAFLLAKLSKKTSRLVKDSKVVLEELRIQKCNRFSLVLSPSIDLEFRIHIMTIWDEVISVEMNNKSIWRDGQLTFEETFKNFAKELNEYFKFSSIEVRGRDFDVVKIFDYSFEVYGPIFKVIFLKKIEEDNIPLTAKTIDNIMECDLDVLVLDLDFPENFELKKPFRVKNVLILENARWLTVENIESINCEKIDLSNVLFSGNELNTIIGNILSGTIKTKHFAADRNSTVGQWKINEILKGITYQTSDDFVYLFPMQTMEWEMTLSETWVSIVPAHSV